MSENYKKSKNYTFIDGQNLYLGINSMEWRLDYHKFRVYLKEKYNVEVAYLFLGFIQEQQGLYSSLQKDGYILQFKPVLPNKDGSHKGNVDADLVLQAMIDFHEDNFEKAVIVTSDGDFYSLVKYFYRTNKLESVLSPYDKTCSSLLRKEAKEKLRYMNNLQQKLGYKRKSTA